MNKNYPYEAYAFEKAFSKKLLAFVFLLSVISSSVNAQLDTKHYVAPLFGREDLGCHYITLSTPESTPFPVTVTDGSGNYITTLTVSSSASVNYAMGCLDTSRLLVTEAQLNTPLNNKGLILTGAKSFYTNIRVLAGAQAGSLTTKGQKASLGTDFRIGHMYNNNGQAYRKSNGFGILATENNTTVVIDDIRPGVIFRGTTGTGTPSTSPNVTVTLNAGQSYVVSEFLDEASATQNVNGGNGIHVTSDKPIVVDVCTWVGGNPLVSGSPSQGRDLGIDQIVPLNYVGSEYVLIKGQGIDNEKTIVIATQDNTDIFINGSSTATSTINAGDYYVIDGTVFSSYDNLYVQTSAPVYMYQTTNGGDGTTDDNERQNGLNFLPPVGCSGGKNVVLPDVTFIGTAYINIIADAGANVYVNGVLQGAGDPVTGTSSYVTYKLTGGYTGDVTITSDKLIRVALINLNGNVGAAGYFSGFTKDVSVQTQTVNGDNIALEGCIPASFTFGIDAPSTAPTVITYTIGGTATNGIDYSHLDNSITIPAGQTQASVIINSISDGVPESTESIYIIYQPDLCSPLDTAYLYINDADPIQFTLNGVGLDCYDDQSGQIQINASGGFTPYTYHVTFPGGQTNTYSSNPVTGLDAGTYTVQVYDIYGCKAEALVIGGVFDADTTFLPDGSGVTYTTQIPISGFDAGQTLTSMSQLQQICATMEHSYLGDLSISVISPSGQTVVLKEQNGGGSCNLGIPYASGPVDGSNSNLTDPGTGYEYCWNASPTYLTMVQESNVFSGTFPSSTGGTYTDFYLPAGSYTPYQNLNGLIGSTLNGNWTLKITDQYALDNGYIFNWNISLLSDLPDTTVNVTQPDSMSIQGVVTQATCGQNNGSINISVNGTHTPFTFHWSNGAATEDISSVGAGTYSVLVTDANGCSDSLSFNLNNTTSISTTATITPVTCQGGSNGAINITTSGGTAPYTYSWSNGANTEDIGNLSAGAYTLTVTGASGCIYSKTYTVTTLPGISISLASSSNEFCGTQNGSLNINVSGGTGSYGYTWSNGASTEDISNIPAGTYSVTVIDGNNCSQTSNYSIVNDVSNCSSYCYLNISTNTITNETCGNAEGAIDININNASQPYVVSWNTGASTEDINAVSAGVYTVTVHDAHQCVATKTITVGNNAGDLSLSNAVINNDNCDHHTGSIDLSPAGGILPYTFQWSNSATTEDISSLGSGSYTVTLTDGNGCSTSNTYSVSNNTGNLTQSAVVTNEICSNHGGGINLTVSGNVGALTYLWSNNATTQDLSNISAGSYSVSITDANGCVLNSGNYVISNASGSLTISSAIITNEHCNNNLGAIDITTTGGTAPLTYSWSNGSATEDISSLNSGTYSVTVTDQNGCSVQSNTYTVFDDAGTLSAHTDYITNETCHNQQGAAYITTSGGTGSYTFLWNDGVSSEDHLSMSAGTYTLHISDAGGCSYDHTVAVTNTNGTLQITNAIVTNETCGNSNGAIDLQVNGGSNPLTYSWSNGAVSQDISGIAAGTYSVEVTDNNGCTGSTTVDIVNNAGSLIFTYQATSEHCNDHSGSIDLSINGGTQPYSYSWNTSDTTEDLSGLAGGTYSCVITDAFSCSVTTGNITIANNPGNLQVVSTATNASCGNNNGSIGLTASGGAGYTYLWSNLASTQTINNLAPGVYSYTVTSSNSCSITDSITIISTSGAFMLDSVMITDEQCNNNAGAINITTTGGSSPITYSWSNTAASQNITNLDQGTYSCVITDNAGCTINTGDLIVSDNPGTLAVSNIVATNANCGNNLGSINLSVSGGTQPYSYSWNNGATTEDIPTGLSAGNYSCTITDANGCSIQAFATVQNTAGSLAITSANVLNETCGNNNGSIDISVQGGNGSYTYTWSQGSTTQDITGLASGIYTVTANDGAGCSTTHSYTVTNAGSNPIISNVSTADEICNNHAGSINITLSGGSAPFSYSWSNGSIYEDINGLISDTYTVNITDHNGCTTSGTYTINENTNGLAITSAVIANENCGNNAGGINISITGGAYPISYHWSNNNNTQDLTNISAGTYSVTISDINGCTINSPNYNLVNITGGMVIAIDSVTNENCGDQSGAIYISVNGGATPYAFSWSNSNSNEDITGLHAGNYTVTVTDSNNCSMQIDTSISNISNGLAITNSYVSAEQCGDTSGFIDITLSGGIQPYQILWSNTDTTEDIYNLSAGTYSVTITDSSGCVIQATYTVNNAVSSGLSANAAIINETCGNSNGSIDVNVTGGLAPLTYTWSSGISTCCQYELQMQDAFGDGWNGGILEVKINGTTVGTYAAAGTGSNAYFNACTGDNIQLVYTAGQWETENTYSLYSPQGALLFSDGPTPATGIVYTATSNCNSDPTYLANISAGVYTLTITDDAGCSITQTYTVTNTNLFTVGGTVYNASCSTCNDGHINIVAGSGDAPYTYLWNTGFTGQNITGLAPGTYWVDVTGASGCTITDTLQVGYNVGLTGNSGSNSDYLLLSPNPATDKVFIEYAIITEEKVDIQILNILGDLIYKQSLENPSGKVSIDTRSFANGVYLVNLISPAGKKSARLIINR